MVNTRTGVAKRTCFCWLISGLSWLIASSVWGQNNPQLAGQVIDQQTGAPLPFVAIYVPTQRVGTLTNEAGFFSLRPGDTLPTDTISFSLIGYQTLYLTQQSLRQNQSNRPLQLKPSPTLLTEVTVRPRIAADKLVQAVIRRIADNYPDQPCLLQAFDREWTRFKPGSLPQAVSIAQPEQRFLALAEGQLEIYKGRYTERAGVDEVRVLKARRKPLATYFRYNADTCRLPLITNGPTLGLLLDIVRSTDQMTFLNPDQLSFYDYEYDNETTIDSRQIVVVGFKPKSERSLVSYFAGRLFIDSQSLAVVRGEFSVAPGGLAVVNKVPRLGRLWLRLSSRQYVINYRRQANGRYVLNDGQVANEYTYVDRPDVCIQNRLSLVVTRLSYGHVQPFNRSEAISFNQSLVEQLIPFEPGFWANDNIIADEP